MNTKRNVGILVFLGGLLVVMAAHATLSMSESVIRKGTTIEVLEPGPDLQDLIDGITDEGPGKPYLIKLGPGVYPIKPDGITGFGLVMAPYISIMGSGQGVTILLGAISAGTLGERSAIVTGANNAALTDLSVENKGASTFSVAIFNSHTSPRIQNVTATASGAAVNNRGVSNGTSSRPTMINVTATASGAASTNIGVSNLSAFPTMINVTATASGAATRNTGVSNGDSSPTMINVTTTASGAAKDNWGVRNGANSSPTMNNVTATASGATSGNVGMEQAPPSILFRGGTQVDSSTLSGTGTGAKGVIGIFAGDQITNTRIVGGVSNDDLTTTNCLNTFDAALDPVDC